MVNKLLKITVLIFCVNWFAIIIVVRMHGC